MDHSIASEALDAARAAGVRAAIAADHDVTQMRLFLGLTQTYAIEFIPSDSGSAGLARAFFTSFPRTSVHSRFVRALSPRLARLPDVSLATVCQELLPQELTPTFKDLQFRTSAGGGRSLSRHLLSVGLCSLHGLRQAARLACAIDVVQTHQVKRTALARTAGFLSERTLSATAQRTLGMAIRDALIAYDDDALSRMLALRCARTHYESSHS